MNRRHGICPVRQDIYEDCFNELIRQCTINCPERGLLLMRVRDEMKITISAYQKLYESSVIFGNKKQVQAEEGLADMERKFEELTRKKKFLENEKIELTNSLSSLLQSYEEIKEYDAEKKAKEVAFLKAQKNQLRIFLDNGLEIKDPIAFKQDFKQNYNA
jgi:dynein light intermediate chain, axonemal